MESSPIATSTTGRYRHSLLAVGAKVYARFGPRQSLTARQLSDKDNGKRPRRLRSYIKGVIVKSGPNASWIVYFYGIKKTAAIKYNKLTVIEEANPQALTQVELATWMSTETVDFITHEELTKYIDDKSDSILDDDYVEGDATTTMNASPQPTNANSEPPKDHPTTPGMVDSPLRFGMLQTSARGSLKTSSSLSSSAPTGATTLTDHSTSNYNSSNHTNHTTNERMSNYNSSNHTFAAWLSSSAKLNTRIPDGAGAGIQVTPQDGKRKRGSEDEMNNDNGTDEANASQTQCSPSVGMSSGMFHQHILSLPTIRPSESGNAESDDESINEYDLDLEDNVLEPLLNYEIAQENIDEYGQVSVDAMYSREKAALIGKYVTVKGKKGKQSRLVSRQKN